LNSFKALRGREFFVILFFKTPGIIKRACFVYPYFFHNLFITLNNLKINTHLSVFKTVKNKGPSFCKNAGLREKPAKVHENKYLGLRENVKKIWNDVMDV
jgi:hypothetical protein